MKCLQEDELEASGSETQQDPEFFPGGVALLPVKDDVAASRTARGVDVVLDSELMAPTVADSIQRDDAIAGAAAAESDSSTVRDDGLQG